MLSEVRQERTNTIWYHVHVKSKGKRKEGGPTEAQYNGGCQGRWAREMGRGWGKGTSFQLEDE